MTVDELLIIIADEPKGDQLDEAALQSLQQELPGLPADYLEFLRRVGYGCIAGIHVYSGPVSPTSIYGGRGEYPGLALIADDGQGTCFAYDIANGFRCVEISPRCEPVESSRRTLADFVAAYCG